MNEKTRALVLSDGEMRISPTVTTILFRANRVSQEVESQAKQVFYQILGATEVTVDPEFRERLRIFDHEDFQEEGPLVWSVSWHHQKTNMRPQLPECSWMEN